MLNKKEFREACLKELKALDREQKKLWDQYLLERTKEKLAAFGVKRMHIYLSMDHEVNTWPIIEYAQKTNIAVFVPKIKKPNILSHHRFLTSQDLVKSKFGIWEPVTKPEAKLQFDLIICPGLAFDGNANRLGYGGGFYDRFLSEQVQAHKLALCYPLNFKTDIPFEAHDIRMDELIVAQG